jgi:hypothetical protein
VGNWFDWAHLRRFGIAHRRPSREAPLLIPLPVRASRGEEETAAHRSYLKASALIVRRANLAVWKKGITIISMFERLNPAVLVLGGVVLVAAIFLIVRSQFSAEARLRRRRRKNYGHTISKAKGPAIKLAVNAEDSKN